MNTLTERLAPLQASLRRFAIPLVAVGAILLIASAFLAWSYDAGVLEDMSIYGNPAPLQYLAVIIGVIALVFIAIRGPGQRFLSWFDASRALGGLGVGTFAFIAIMLICIAVESGGIINIDPGGWLALVAAILMMLGGWAVAPKEVADPIYVKPAAWAEIVAIVLLLAALLFFAAFILGRSDAGSLLGSFAFGGAVAAGLARGGVFTWLSMAAQRHRPVLMIGALVTAFLFPLTQNGSDANMSVATQVIVFATTALGLNIVVGLAGLLDLGYIAFLGTGAYVGAMMSMAASATIGWKPPFLVVMLVGACTSALLGLIIGSPTLRVSGDYLAIVTLAFGEIFRITVNNLDGTNGPDLTHGPNGIAGIPDLNFFGFNFGDEHMLFGIPITRFANYYCLLLLVATFIIIVFTRLNNSRLGRGWIAIREDERAAEAMGVNIFGLKLLAFAGGAFLAGLAGTVKAHLDVSVTPDQYVFVESSFLLAAVVLGGMGTVLGVIVGATILKLLPEKLRAVNDYRLLIFGVLLVLMMRFRPEGLIASRRRQLEFHDEDQGLADRAEEVHTEQEATA